MSLPARIPRDVPKVPERRRDGDDPKYLAWLGTLPSLLTGREPCDVVHHLMRAVNDDGTRAHRGHGIKNMDRYGLPIEHWFHSACHGTGDDEALMASLGFDARGICSSLWGMRNWADRDEYARNLIFRARQQARLKTDDWSAKIAQLAQKYAGPGITQI